MGLLANDVDLDSYEWELMVDDWRDPAHGQLQVNSDGSFMYTPDADFCGVDIFYYIITDNMPAKRNNINLDSNIATVTLIVDCVDDAPVSQNDHYATDSATVLTVDGPGVLSNDHDVDDGLITPQLVTLPSHGTLRLHLDGGLIYTPNRLYSGIDSFIYRTFDGALYSGNATVYINVTLAPNAAPVAYSDNYNLNEGQTLTVTALNGVLHNDKDIEGDALTAVLNTTTGRGTLTLNSDGSFTYVPDPYTYGYDFFKYWAYDGQKSAEVGIVWLLVRAVDDKPVPQNDEYYTNEDTALSVTAVRGVLANDIDIDSATFTASVSVNPSHGSLVLNADGSFVYTPEEDFNGFDQFLYIADDGTLTSNPAIVVIRVDAVNDAPVASDDEYETNQNVPIVVDAPGLLENDFDVDSLIVKPMVVEQPSNGTLKVQIDGSFVYTPDFFFSGNDSFTYRLTDGQALSQIVTVYIFVNESDSAPVAKSDHYIITENNDGYDFTADYLLTLTDNDSDAEEDQLTLSIVSKPEKGSLTQVNAKEGWVIFTPPKNFKGDVTFTYKLHDGYKHSKVATVTLSVDTTYGFTSGEIAGIVISVVFLVVVIVLFVVCILLARKKQNQVKPMDR